MATVAVFSDPDADLPYVAMADEAVRLCGAAPSDTYLSVEALVDAARRSGADAVHPGYGFLSENAAFAAACQEVGLVFVGPSPETIEAMGVKTVARELMARAGVPVLPGHRVDPGDDLHKAAATVGLPLLVKAAAGGGGRGMRLVKDQGEVEEAVDSAQREAQASFGDPSVYLERYVEHPRHIEVQVLGDTSGSVVSLFERECSIQRRYQKLIEEAPSPVVDQALRQALSAAAVTAARAIGYLGAGTVEFVVDPDRSFYFLEVNTRLQVEHPVTEMITGLDLVELQLRVAQGEEVALDAGKAPMSGHAVEARLYAEDPAEDFLPTSGTLERLELPRWEGVRVDAGYQEGSVVSTYYDAMVAKVVAWAPSRSEAVRRLTAMLAASQVHGPATNRRLLIAVLSHPDFLEGRFDTGFLERHRPAELLATTKSARTIHAVAAALSGSEIRRGARKVQGAVRSGWRNVPSSFQEVELHDAQGPLRVGYRWGRAPGDLQVQVDRVDLQVELWSCGAEAVELSIAGIRRRCQVQWRGGRAYVDSTLGFSQFDEVPRFAEPGAAQLAGSLVAPLPGSVTELRVSPGQLVAAGDPLVVLEAMKMHHQVRAPSGGRVAEVRVAAGEQVETGQVLVVLEDPS